MTENATITTDDSLWPLLLVSCEGTVSSQQFEEHLAMRAAYLRRGEPHLTLYDLRRTGYITPEQRQRLVEWLREHDTLLRERVLGSALVITSPVLRLTLSVVMYLIPPCTPYQIVPTLPEAAAWAARRFDDAGLLMPARHVREHFGLLPTRRTG